MFILQWLNKYFASYGNLKPGMHLMCEIFVWFEYILFQVQFSELCGLKG